MNRKVWATEEKTAIVPDMIRGDEPMAVISACHVMRSCCAVAALSCTIWAIVARAAQCGRLASKQPLCKACR